MRALKRPVTAAWPCSIDVLDLSDHARGLFERGLVPQPGRGLGVLQPDVEGQVRVGDRPWSPGAEDPGQVLLAAGERLNRGPLRV